MKTAKAVQQDQNRADYLEYLYELYDRGNRETPHCFTYTGLYQMHIERVGADVVALQQEWFDVGLIVVTEDEADEATAVV